MIRTLAKNNFLAGICHPISKLNTGLIDWLPVQNKLILTYTCNIEAEIQKTLNLEGNVLISDYPDKTLKVRG